jgi:uncharacterized protein YggU (UPF0235/DUF167 family)
MDPTNKKEWDQIKLLAEKIGYGEMRVIIQKGKPSRVELLVKSVRLDDQDEFAQGLNTISL